MKDMLDQILQIEKKYKELGETLSDPAVIQDYNKFRDLSKQRKSMEETVNTYYAWKTAQDAIDSLEVFKPVNYDEIVDVDGNVRNDVAGLNTLIYESSQANIQILSEKSYKENGNIFKHCQEKDLVHELLHTKYAYMESSRDTYETVQLELMEHQRLEEMAKSLIMAKYGVDYDYFM